MQPSTTLWRGQQKKVTDKEDNGQKQEPIQKKGLIAEKKEKRKKEKNDTNTLVGMHGFIGPHQIQH